MTLCNETRHMHFCLVHAGSLVLKLCTLASYGRAQSEHMVQGMPHFLRLQAMHLVLLWASLIHPWMQKHQTCIVFFPPFPFFFVHLARVTERVCPYLLREQNTINTTESNA